MNFLLHLFFWFIISHSIPLCLVICVVYTFKVTFCYKNSKKKEENTEKRKERKVFFCVMLAFCRYTMQKWWCFREHFFEITLTDLSTMKVKRKMYEDRFLGRKVNMLLLLSQKPAKHFFFLFFLLFVAFNIHFRLHFIAWISLREIRIYIYFDLIV